LIQPFLIFVEKIALNVTDTKILTAIKIKFFVLRINVLLFIQVKLRKYWDVLFLNEGLFFWSVFLIFKSAHRKLLDIRKYFSSLLISVFTLLTRIFVIFFLYFIDAFLNQLFLIQKTLWFLYSRVNIRWIFRFERLILEKFLDWHFLTCCLLRYFLWNC